MTDLGPRQKVELIDRICEEVAPRYTLTQLQALMRGYQAPDWQYGGTSRAGYLEARLTESDDETVLRVAEDFGLVQPSTKPSQTAASRTWKVDGFRLFLSHTSKYKKGVHELAQALARFEIASFVAHDSIEPGREWQAQIELALRTMDALAVIITPDMQGSKWCDQEVGWAIGSDKLVIPVKADSDPYGFVGRYQAIVGAHRAKADIAHDLACAIAASAQARQPAEPVALALALQAPADKDEERFWKSVAAVVDNGMVKTGFALRPVVERIRRDKIFRPGLSEELASLLRRNDLAQLADEVMNAEIPF